MTNHIVAAATLIALTIAAAGASASTASQREHRRGDADCKAGRWDDTRSYQSGGTCESVRTRCRSSGD